MTIETMQTLSVIFFIAAAVMLLLAVAVFFLMRIPAVIGDMTGTTARKEIEEIRRKNEEPIGKGRNLSVSNRNRGIITDRISASGRLLKRNEEAFAVGTSKLSTVDLVEAAENSMAMPSAVNLEGNETALLANQEVDVNGSAETTILSENLPKKDTCEVTNEEFSVDVEMQHLSSSEIIE